MRCARYGACGERHPSSDPARRRTRVLDRVRRLARAADARERVGAVSRRSAGAAEVLAGALPLDCGAWRADEPGRRLPPGQGAGQLVRVQREAAVAVVTVDRQEAMNALDVATLTQLRDELRSLAGDDAVRSVVLTGAGDRAFVAGADIKYMSGLGVDEAKGWGALGHEATRLLETMPQPTIAAIDGFALGGGCELALACDIRYAGTRAKLGQPEVNLGIIPGWGGTQRLARVCGLGIAKELIFTGR